MCVCKRLLGVLKHIYAIPLLQYYYVICYTYCCSANDKHTHAQAPKKRRRYPPTQHTHSRLAIHNATAHGSNAYDNFITEIRVLSPLLIYTQAGHTTYTHTLCTKNTIHALLCVCTVCLCVAECLYVLCVIPVRQTHCASPPPNPYPLRARVSLRRFYASATTTTTTSTTSTFGHIYF